MKTVPIKSQTTALQFTNPSTLNPYWDSNPRYYTLNAETLTTTYICTYVCMYTTPPGCFNLFPSRALSRFPKKRAEVILLYANKESVLINLPHFFKFVNLFLTTYERMTTHLKPAYFPRSCQAIFTREKKMFCCLFKFCLRLLSFFYGFDKNIFLKMSASQSLGNKLKRQLFLLSFQTLFSLKFLALKIKAEQ
jgi:hypothetical protein